MANDFLIELTGGLDATKSTSQINSDIQSLEKSLQKVKLQAEIDPNKISNIENQLKNLKATISSVTVNPQSINGIVSQINASLSGIQISNISINPSGIKQQGQQVGQQVGQQIATSISSAIQKNVAFEKSFKIGASGKNNVAKEAEAYFKGISNGIVTVKEEMRNLNGESSLNGFVVNIRNAKGEIEELRYALRDIAGSTDQHFEYVGGSINDSNVRKQYEAIEKAHAEYTAKLAQFKSSNGQILSGISGQVQDFENKLVGLKNGTATIDDVTKSFNSLKASASNITSELSGQLNKVDAAIRKIDKGDETIRDLTASFKGLNNAPKQVNKELKDCAKLLANVRQIESQQGRNQDWAKAYREWEKSIDSLRAKLKVLQKEQKNNASSQVYNTSDLKKANIPYMQKQYNTIEKQMKEIQSMANAKGWKNFEVKGVEKANGQIKSLKIVATEATGAVKELNFEARKLQGSGKVQTGLMQVGDVKVIKTATSAVAELSEKAKNIQIKLDDGTYGSKVADLIAKTQQWTDINGRARISVSELNAAYATLENAKSDEDKVNAAMRLDEEIKKVTNSIRTMNATYAKDNQISSTHQKIQEFYDKNSAAHKQWGAQLKQMLSQTADGAQLTKAQLATIDDEFINIKNAARQAGKLGLSFFDGIKQQASKFASWFSTTTLVMTGIREAKKMVTAVYDIDTAMTSLYKVTDETDKKYESFLNSASKSAKELGRSVSSLVEQTASWAKLGYNVDESAELAKTSSIYANVGEVSDETAVSDIVTAIKAFNIEAENSITVVDKLNNLGNKYATDSASLGEGLSKSASALKLAGNDIDQTLAMITGGTEITQNASEMGNALKVLSMRIRGKLLCLHTRKVCMRCYAI